MKKIIDFKKPYIYVIIIVVILLAIFLPRLVASFKGENRVAMAIPDLEMKAQKYAAKDSLAIEDGDLLSGSKRAKLKIFVYEDYSDVFSANLDESIEKIKAESDGDLAVVYRPYVAANALSSQSASLVACAAEQGKWHEMRALLFSRLKNRQGIDDSSELASKIELDQQSLDSCLTKWQKSGKIEELASKSDTLAIQGSPTIFIGDEMIIGARPYEDFIDSNGDRIKGLKRIVSEKLAE